MLKKNNRLKKKKEFNYIYKKGNIAHSISFTIHYVRAFKNFPQIGISVSKQVGNSVIRSRVKRIISEACRLNIEKFAVKNYVITAKEISKEKTSKDIELELVRVLTKNKLLRDLECSSIVKDKTKEKGSQRSKQGASHGKEEQTN